MNTEEAAQFTAETALQVANEVVLDKTGKHLTDVQQKILQGSWDNKTYEAMTSSGYSSQHLKNEASVLWKLLSKLLGGTVNKQNFRAALERQWQSHNFEPNAMSLRDLAATTAQLKQQPSDSHPFVLDGSITQDEVDKILSLFLIRDTAVLEKNTKLFLTTQLNMKEIKSGSSKHYVSCSRMTSLVLQINTKDLNEATHDMSCSPAFFSEQESDVDYIVAVREDYHHNGRYTHSGFISYSLKKINKDFKIVDLEIQSPTSLSDTNLPVTLSIAAIKEQKIGGKFKKIKITLDATFTEDSKMWVGDREIEVPDLLLALRKKANHFNINVTKIEEGSIKITLEGSPEGLERLAALFESGELTEVLGIPVENVEVLNESSDDAASHALDDNHRLEHRLVQEIVGEALIRTFPAEADLEMMLQEELGIELKAIGTGGDYEKIVNNLVRTLDSIGRLPYIIETLLRVSRRNPKLEELFKTLTELEPRSSRTK